MRIIFLGASDFSSIVFNKLVEQYEVVAVITPPDKEFGRGKVYRMLTGGAHDG